MKDWHMRREIGETPAMLRARAGAWAEAAADLNTRVLNRKNTVLLGRGSSGHACTFAAYLHGLQTGRPAMEFRPWLATQDAPRADLSDLAALVYSFSGQSTDIAHSARWLRERGAAVVGVTNAPDRECVLGHAAEELFHLGIGPERAVPATRSFCAQLFAGAALVGMPITEAAEDTATCMDTLLASDAGSRLTDFLEGARTILWIGRGTTLAAALDAALKTQEASGVPSQAWSTAEFLHGPIGAVDAQDRVVLFTDTDEPVDSFSAVTTALIGRGVQLLRAGPGLPGEHPLVIPTPKARWARTPVLAMLAQLAAVDLADRRGVDPDSPRGLRKVTMT